MLEMGPRLYRAMYKHMGNDGCIYNSRWVEPDKMGSIRIEIEAEALTNGMGPAVIIGWEEKELEADEPE